MSSDYLMRQINDMVRLIANTIFQKSVGEYEFIHEDGSFSDGGFLGYRLKKMVLEGDINGAENLLFETLEADPRQEYLPVALDFYSALQEKSDAQLISCRFSRQEIGDGLAELQKIYNIQSNP